jgi:hypothetical protein
MTREQYLQIRNDHEADIMPVMFYYFNKRARNSIFFDAFAEAFTFYVTSGVGVFTYSNTITKVFTELDKEFNINQ